jgi:hypothetical protein
VSKALRAGWAIPLALALLAWAVASLARHGLVEPPAMAARCEASPGSSVPCALRWLTVQAFIGQRLAVAALLLAVLALLTRHRAVALAAGCVGAAALALYTAGPGAAALLAAALVLAAPSGGPGRHAR